MTMSLAFVVCVKLLMARAGGQIVLTHVVHGLE
jgi:hypothetical protein